VALSCCWKTLSCCVLHLPARGLLEKVSFGQPATPASGLNIPVDCVRDCAGEAAPRSPKRFSHLFFTDFRKSLARMASTRTPSGRRDAIATAVSARRSGRLRGCRDVEAETCGWLDWLRIAHEKLWRRHLHGGFESLLRPLAALASSTLSGSYT
jgi:hypothetical protein